MARQLVGARDALRAALGPRAHGDGFALVGGLAVSVRTEPRFTRDVDLAVSVGADVEAEACVWRLQGLGYRLELVLEHTRDRLSTVRLRPPRAGAGGIVIDLLFASSGIEPEIVGRAEPIEALPGVVVPVALGSDLLAMKLLSVEARRPQDAQDIESLLGVLDAGGIESCRQALRLLTARGFNRDRDLEAMLDGLLARP